MPTVLVPSASYILSDYLLTSEGTFCYNFFKHMAEFGYEFEAISNYVRVKSPLVNSRFYQVGTFEPRKQPRMKAVAYAEFLAKSMLKSRKILSNRDIAIIHHVLPAVYDQTFSLLALLRQTKGLPFVFGPISAHVTSVFGRSIDERFLMPITTKLHQKTIEKCDKVVTVTEQVKRLFKRVCGKRITVIPFAVDTDVFKPADVHNDAEILYVGSLYPIKGIDYLIRAMALVLKERKDARLQIVGDGPEKGRLLAMAHALGIEKQVTIEGFVPYSRIAEHYQRCDIFVYVTLGEPFGRSIIEAMACGKPTIASRLGGPAEIIEDEKSGLLIPPMNPKVLCKKIIELIENPRKRKLIGRNARARVMERYSWEKVSKAYYNLYRTLI